MSEPGAPSRADAPSAPLGAQGAAAAQRAASASPATDDRRPLADAPRRVEMVSSERVFEGKVWDIRRDTFRLGADGRDIVREYVDHTGAVGVLALDDDDRVFLIAQYRHPIGATDWEIPAGLLDVEGESPLVAAQRELAEEADLVATDWALLTEFASTPGGSDEIIRIYLARGLAHTGETFAREDEEAEIETRWVPLEACVDAVLERRIRNAPLSLAVLAAHAAKQRGWSTLADPETPWPSPPKGGRTA